MIVKYTVATRGLHVIPYIAASVHATVNTCYYNIYVFFFLVGNMIFWVKRACVGIVSNGPIHPLHRLCFQTTADEKTKTRTYFICTSRH